MRNGFRYLRKAHFVLGFFVISWACNAQQQGKAFSANIEALDSLHAFFAAKWKADSLRLVDLGLPLVATTDRITLSFIGFEDNEPIYVTTTTNDEVLSYYGDDLWAAPYNVTGTGYFLGMWEAFAGSAALPDPNNGNLQTSGSAPSRVSIQESGFISSHATNVAVRMAGDGAADPNGGLGIAKTGLVAAWDISDVYSEMATSIPLMLVSNHSYGQITGWTSPISITLGGVTKSINWWSESNVSKTEDYKFGRYGGADYDFDVLSRYAPYHCIVKSAGNDRGDNGSVPVTTFYTTDGVTYTFDTYSSPVPEVDGGADGFDCLPTGSVAKNAFVIGSCNNISGGYTTASDVVVSSFSSFGPTDDGRIKPDFVAPGPGGTSYAAPNASGAILLVQEVYFKQTGNYLKSPTVKALLAQTAYEAGTSEGPDYKHGWGLINPKGAADVILDQTGTQQIFEESLNNGQTEYYLVYSDGTGPITATLSWLDPEITPLTRTYNINDLNNATSRLVNDLDMRLVSLADAVQASPYVLDPANPANAATTGDNFRDNIEKIVWSNPTAGWYAVRINHKGTLSASQEYSLVLSGVKQGECAVETLPTITNTYNNGSGWSTTPTSGQSVAIEGNLTVSSDISFADVVINSGVTVTIANGITLTVTGNLWSFADVTFAGDGKLQLAGSANQQWCGGGVLPIVELNNSAGAQLAGSSLSITNYVDAQSGTLAANGKLVLASSAGNYAQIHESGGIVSGRITFQQTINSEGWHTIASPVATTLGDLVEDMTDYVLQANRGSVYTWDAPTGEWVHPADTTATFDKTNPYQVFFGTSNGTRQYSTIPFTLNLSGAVTSGAVDNTLVYGAASTTSGNQQGWNLLANPYPENLDWTSIKNNFGALNINAAYYIWDAQSGTYKNHDGSTGDVALGGYIAPGQAFFVKVNDATAAATTAFDFTNANRTLNKADFLKQTTPQLAINGTQNGITDVFYVAFAQGGGTAFNSRVDSYKLFSPNTGVPQIYQPLDSASGVAIKYLDLAMQPQSIALAFSHTAPGTAEIAAEYRALPINTPVFLEDVVRNTIHDLRTGPYRFNHKPANHPARFILHVGYSPEAVATNGLQVWGSNGELHIKLLQDMLGATVTIHNVVGARVYSSQHDVLQTLTLPFTEPGVYIITVSGANGETFAVKWVN